MNIEMDLSTALHLCNLEDGVDDPPGAAPRPPHVSEGSASAERLLLAVSSEIASMAGSIAASASVVNALASGRHPCVRQATLSPNLPMEPAVYQAVLPKLAVAELAPELFAEIQHFHVRLGYSRKSALAFCEGSNEPPMKGGVHLDVLAAAWRDLCASTLEILDLLARNTALDGLSGWAVAALPRCQEMLASAARGGCPCIMTDGSVEVPGIAERRQHVRHLVSWSAGMLRGGDMLTSRIEDVSIGGLGVTSRAEVAIDEPVIIDLMGRMLSGHVSWTAPQRFGVRLAVPLSETDPLFAAARGA